MLRFFPALLLGLLLAGSALAQDDPAPKTEALYVPLVPPFVVNYGGVGKLRYLKAEMTVRVNSLDAASRLRHHMPAVRDRLVTLLSAQDALVIDTQEGKAQLRQDALTEVRQVIELEEGGESGVVDVFFDNLVVQR